MFFFNSFICSKRERHLPNPSPEVLEKRAALEKRWCQYKRELHLADLQMLDRVLFSQQKALDELHRESEELYNEAIQVHFWYIKVCPIIFVVFVA